MQPWAVTGGMSCETARCETMAVVVQATAQEIVDSYADIMTEQYTSRMARKLGLCEYRKELAVGLITLMYEDKADFTNTFRAMAAVSADDEPSTVPAALDEVSLTLFCLHCLVLPVSGRSIYSCGGLKMMLLRTINCFLLRILVLHASFTEVIAGTAGLQTAAWGTFNTVIVVESAPREGRAGDACMLAQPGWLCELCLCLTEGSG